MIGLLVMTMGMDPVMGVKRYTSAPSTSWAAWTCCLS